jgi:hypothetical protein
MARYRSYLLDHSGNIFHGEDVEALDDAAAVDAGWKLLEAHNAVEADAAHGIEIWRDSDLIFSSRTRSV